MIILHHSTLEREFRNGIGGIPYGDVVKVCLTLIHSPSRVQPERFRWAIGVCNLHGVHLLCWSCFQSPSTIDNLALVENGFSEGQKVVRAARRPVSILGSIARGNGA